MHIARSMLALVAIVLWATMSCVMAEATEPATHRAGENEFGPAPHGFGAMPNGFTAAPLGFNNRPSGFDRAPTGFGVIPGGFNKIPNGFMSQPSGFGRAPVGFMSKPNAWGSAPVGFGVKPNGFGALPSNFTAPPRTFDDVGVSTRHDWQSPPRPVQGEHVNTLSTQPFSEGSMPAIENHSASGLHAPTAPPTGLHGAPRVSSPIKTHNSSMIIGHGDVIGSNAGGQR